MEFSIYDESVNQNLEKNYREMVTSSSALGILREQLSKNIGLERIKGFLFRYGWELGVNDGKEIMITEKSLDYLIKYGPIRHITNGHIKGIKHECKVEMDDDKNIQSVLGTGIWIGSYEAEEHIKRLGISKTPVCHTLAGYASGYMSTIFGQPLLAKELTCVGKGDSECSWVVKPQKEWESEMKDEIQLNNETPIVKELEYTYEQLLEQKNFLIKLAEFQKKVTEEISNGSNLQKIANMVYELIKIPIIFEDIDTLTITYAGLSEQRYIELRDDLEHYLEENEAKYIQEIKEKRPIPFRRKVINTKEQNRLITPVTVQKEVIGYCSFIYEDMQKCNIEDDYLILERIANAASLILLNEKTKFESFERMKGNFLEQILYGQLPLSEIMKRGRYTGLDLSHPYYVVVMEYKKIKLSIEEEFLLHEQILEMTFRYFREKKQIVLVGQREGNMVLFITKETVKNSTIYELVRAFHDYLKQKYPKGEFKFGISNKGDDITNVARYYEEATIAMRLKMRNTIVEFHSLGIVGVLINSRNLSGIKMIAADELGALYNTTDPKNIELIKTLYIYLLNGGKLEQTMSDLSLSMSGLRHRIKRIESLLEKDLRDPNETHQLLMIIKSLIALGELNID